MAQGSFENQPDERSVDVVLELQCSLKDLRQVEEELMIG